MRVLALLIFIVSVGFAKPHILVEDPWVREVPPVSTMSAGFMKIINTGKEDDYLIGVESPVSEVAEIHTTIMEDGMMKMRKIEQVKIPAGQTVEFKPMGKHIMLINLKKPLKAGDKVKITLIFKKSGKITVTAPVRSMKMHMHH
ncbi:MAG: copper chaperone PCu(A)C [Aquificae bacterium]|nr:copper chaperone PCu(A)C [Aquificota bacterium]